MRPHRQNSEDARRPTAPDRFGSPDDKRVRVAHSAFRTHRTSAKRMGGAGAIDGA